MSTSYASAPLRRLTFNHPTVPLILFIRHSDIRAGNNKTIFGKEKKGN